MSTDTRETFSKVLRNLRFDWTQDPEIVLNERLTFFTDLSLLSNKITRLTSNTLSCAHLLKIRN